MLKLLNGSSNPVLMIDDFYIEELWSGLDELVFDIPITDPNYKEILEESIVEYEQPYVVKAIDGGTSSAKVKCQLDVDELKADMLLNYNNGGKTVRDTIEEVLPRGWTVADHAYFINERTIEMEAGTPFDVISQCQETYSAVIRYDVKEKKVHIWDPDSFEPMGAFASRDLNLQEINYKGKSSDFATRLYGYGKDGLSVASVNGGKPYVENRDYADKIICAYWKDDRYTDEQTLLEDMKKKLKELSVPSVSYSCSVMDLAKTNPELYAHQNFSLMQVIRLVDDVKGTSVNHQVVQYRRYPFYPERNVVTLSTVAPKIQSTVKHLQYNQDNPSSPFRQQMQAAIESATEKIAFAEKGYVILPKDEEGNITELLIMDTPSKETATKLWRWNMGGLGYSSQGYNNPRYSTAITMNGEIVANMITTGEMLCDRIRGGTLELGGLSNGKGVLTIEDAAGNEIGRWDSSGITAKKGTFQGSLQAATGSFSGEVTAQSGKIGRWYITSNMLCSSQTFDGSRETNNCGMGYNSDWAFWAGAGRFRVSDTGYLYCEHAKISGEITATSGTIGGNTITGNGMETHGGSFIVGNDSFIGMKDFEGNVFGIIRPYTFENNPNLSINGLGNRLYLGAWDTPGGIFAMEGMFYEDGSYISSDRRLKRNIDYLLPELSLAFIRRLKPASFRYKNKEEVRRGFIAQDVLEAMSESNTGRWDVVTEYPHADRKTGEESIRYTLAYTELLADIVGAVQELDRKVEKLYGKTGDDYSG